MTTIAKPVRPLPVNGKLALAPRPTSNDADASLPLGRIRAVPSPAKPTSGPPEPALSSAPAMAAISHFIDLEIEARQCADLDSLRFAIVNATRKLLPFEQAFLVEPSPKGGWSVSRASSVAKVDHHAPLLRSLEAWLGHPSHAELLIRGDQRIANLDADARQWHLPEAAFPFPNALWLPIKNRDGRILASLLALRSEIWLPQHSALALPLAGAYGHAWDALTPRMSSPLSRVRSSLRAGRLALALSLAGAALAFVPVPLSTLAPAEVVPTETLLVTAPIEGVIGDVLAPPGTWVEKGAPIIRFVDIKLRNELELASRSKSVAAARYFKIVQSATATQKDMQDLATTKAELDLANAEHAYAADLLARAEIRASHSGFLIYSSKTDLVGKPVAVGEKLLEIGDPSRTDIKIEMPVSDAIAAMAGNKVSLFLDGDPLRAIEGTITRTSYRPTLTAEQQLAYRVHASFDDKQARRIGLRGVTRIQGEDVSLWFYLFRRPISAIRQKFGL